MKLGERHTRRNRRHDFFSLEDTPIVVTPGRLRLLKKWPEFKEYLKRPLDGSDFDPEGINMYESYMKKVWLISVFVPERLHDANLPEAHWDNIRKNFEFQKEGHILDVKNWLTQAIGTGIIFPQHAPEIVAYVRPQMQRMLHQTNFFSDVGRALILLSMADPSFPQLDVVVTQKVPDLRKKLERSLTQGQSASQIIFHASRLFLLSPVDRDQFQARVDALLVAKKEEIDNDFIAGAREGRFAGYMIEEPWYSVVVTPQARLKEGRLVFEQERPTRQTVPLPIRSTL